MLPPRRATVFLLTLACGLGGFLGYRRGYTNRMEKAESTASEASPGSTSHTTRTDLPRTLRPEERLDRLHRLLQDGLLSRAASWEAWNIIRDLPRDDVERELREMLAAGNETHLRSMGSMLCSRLAQFDPAAAGELADAQPDVAIRCDLLAATLSSWMRRDPDAALAWGQAHAEKEAAPIAQGMMAHLLAASGPEAALAKAATLGSDITSATVKKLTSSCCTTAESRQAFLAAIATRLTPEEQEDARFELNSNWGRFDPAGALEGFAEDPNKTNQMGNTLRAWLRSDASAAVAWALAHPEYQSGPELSKAYAGMAVRFPDQAADLLPQLQGQPGFMPAVMASLQASFLQDGWSPYGRNEKDAKGSAEALRAQYQHWDSLDPAAAQAWKAALLPEVKAAIDSPAPTE